MLMILECDDKEYVPAVSSVLEMMNFLSEMANFVFKMMILCRYTILTHQARVPVGISMLPEVFAHKNDDFLVISH